MYKFLPLLLFASLLFSPFYSVKAQHDTIWNNPSKKISATIKTNRGNVLEKINLDRKNRKHGVQEIWGGKNYKQKSTQYKHGKIQGETIVYNNAGRVANSCFYKYFPAPIDSSLKHGACIFYNYNGDLKKEEKYKKGLLNGKSVEYNSSGEVYLEKIFKKGLQIGEETRYDSQKNIDTKINYSTTLDTTTGNLKSVLHGPSLQYYANGTIKESKNYVFGKLNGEFKVFYDNGQLHYYSDYKLGRQVGLYRIYGKDGDVQYEVSYKSVPGERPNTWKALKHGVEKRYKNGELVSLTNFINDTTNGKQLSYFEDGTLASEMNLTMGVLDGNYFKYHPNGQVKEKYFYLPNPRTKSNVKYAQVGNQHRYDSLGVLTKWLYYDSTGNVIATREYDNRELKSINYENIFSVNFHPSGELLNLKIHHYRSSHYDFYYTYYQTGAISTMRITNPNFTDKVILSFLPNGRLLAANIDKHQTPLIDTLSDKIAQQWKTPFDLDVNEHTSLFTDSILNGLYTLKRKNGSVFAQFNFKDNLPHGSISLMGKTPLDTLYFATYQNGTQDGYYVTYFNKQLSNKGVYKNGKAFTYESYNKEGLPTDKHLQTGYKGAIESYSYTDGKLSAINDWINGLGSSYDAEERIRYETKLLSEEPLLKTSIYYYPETGQIESQYFTKNNKKDSTATYYYPNGTVKYAYNYKDGKREGNYIAYDSTGMWTKKGAYIADKQDGTWYTQDENSIDSSFYTMGKLSVKRDYNLVCQCLDTATSYSDLKYATRAKALAEYRELKTYLPQSWIPIDTLNYKALFYHRFYSNGGYGSSSIQATLLPKKPLEFYVPADEQIRLNLAPCKTEGYYTEIPFYVSFQKDYPGQHTGASLHPKKISLRFEKGPVKSADAFYDKFTALFDVEQITVRDQNNIIVTLPKEAKIRLTDAILGEYLVLRIRAATPVLSYKTYVGNDNISYNLTEHAQKLGLKPAEQKTFYGLISNYAVAEIPVVNGPNTIPFIGESKTLMLGGKFAAGILTFKAKKTTDGSLEFTNKFGTAKTNIAELKQNMLKHGFTRLEFDFDEAQEVLTVQFFIE